MKNNPKFYFIILTMSLITFIFEVFIFRFTGAFGLLLCILSLYLTVGSTIRLLKISDLFNTDIFEDIDILFFL